MLAPLFREARSVAEKSAAAELSNALERDHVGLVIPRGLRVSANVPALTPPAGNRPLLAEHGLSIELKDNQRIVTRRVTDRGRSTRLEKEIAIPRSSSEGKSERKYESPTRIFAGRWLQVFAFPENLLLDLDTQRWISLPSDNHVLAADERGVFIEHDGTLHAPDGAELKLHRSTPQLLVGQFAIWPDESIEHIGTRARFETPGLPLPAYERCISPDSNSLAAVNRYTGQISIWRLGSAIPLYEEMPIPPMQYLWLDWGSCYADWLFAAGFRELGQARVLLLIHIPSKTVYQITDGNEENQFIETQLFSYLDERP